MSVVTHEADMAAPIALRVVGVSKSFGGTHALVDASLEVSSGSIHALAGSNGSGKSTLMKILAGVVPASAGQIEIGGEVHDVSAQTPARARACGLHFVHQENSTFPDLSIAENLAIGRGYETGLAGRVRWSALRKHATEVMRRFEITAHPDTRVGTLGAATQTMVAIARALQDQEGEHDGVLLLDEPTASLPRHEVSLLLAALRRYARAGQTIVYVTHRLEEIVEVADRATVLRDGHVVATVERAELDENTLVSLIVGQAIETAELRATRAPGDVILEASGAGARDLQLRAGEVVGVAGLLGSGRTALLRELFGAAPTSREVRLDGQPVTVGNPRSAMALGIAYIPEDRKADAAFAELSVKENMSVTVLWSYWRPGYIRRRLEKRLTRELMITFGVRASSVEARLASLSGGNQQKVVLARWLRRAPRILLLDEPTQGVDVGARAEIHNIIRGVVNEGASALLVSSDFAEIASVCDRAIVMQRGRVVAEVGSGEMNEDALNLAVYVGDRNDR